jgi:putative restriction endonuclease
VDHGAPDLDKRVRVTALAFLANETQLHGEVLPRTTLATGFTLEGTRIPLIGPQSIFKSAILPEIPLTITTVPVVEGQLRNDAGIG